MNKNLMIMVGHPWSSQTRHHGSNTKRWSRCMESCDCTCTHWSDKLAVTQASASRSKIRWAFAEDWYQTVSSQRHNKSSGISPAWSVFMTERDSEETLKNWLPYGHPAWDRSANNGLYPSATHIAHSLRECWQCANLKEWSLPMSRQWC